MTPELPPLTRTYRLPFLLLRRRKALAELMPAFAGQVLDLGRFQAFVAALRRLLPGAISYATLEESVQGLAGNLLTVPRLTDLVQRLTGNLYRLQAGRAVPPWSPAAQRTEWVPVQIMGAKWARNSKQRLGVRLTCKVLAGGPCPGFCHRWWSLQQCRYVARDLGFSRPPSPKSWIPIRYPYTTPEELVTMRCYVLVEPRLCSGDGPGFRHIQVTPDTRRWNREQLQYRARRDEAHACPQEQPDGLPCWRCPFGFVTCRAATHRENYRTGLCTSCGDKEADFDPSWSTTLCVACCRAEVQERKHHDQT